MFKPELIDNEMAGTSKVSLTRIILWKNKFFLGTVYDSHTAFLYRKCNFFRFPRRYTWFFPCKFARSMKNAKKSCLRRYFSQKIMPAEQKSLKNRTCGAKIFKKWGLRRKKSQKIGPAAQNVSKMRPTAVFW